MRNLLIALFALGCVNGFAQNGGFAKENVPDLSVGRIDVCSSLLPDGSVVVFGGHTPGFVRSNTAERWKVGDAAWTVFTMNDYRDFSAMVRLDSSHILLAGGMDSNLGVGQLISTEVFDANGNIFTPRANMNVARTMCRGAMLSNGKILFVGNWYNDASVAEVYNVQNNTFTPTNTVVTQRACAYVIPLTNDDALIMGGFQPYGGNVETIELYHAETNSFTAVRNTLLENETGWIYNTYYPNGSLTPEDRLIDGKYYFSAYKNLIDGGVQYMIASVDRVSMAITPIITSSNLFTYHTGDSINLGLSGQLSIDKKAKKLYFWANNATKNETNVYPMALYSYDLTTQKLNIATGFQTFSYSPVMGANCTMPNGKIVFLGGNLTSNFDAHPYCFMANPNDNANALSELTFPNNELRISSNARNNLLQISYSSPKNGMHSLKIYDSNGKCVQSSSLILHQGINYITMDRVTLNKGVFLLQISNQDGRVSKKFVR